MLLFRPIFPANRVRVQTPRRSNAAAQPSKLTQAPVIGRERAQRLHASPKQRKKGQLRKENKEAAAVARSNLVGTGKPPQERKKEHRTPVLTTRLARRKSIEALIEEVANPSDSSVDKRVSVFFLSPVSSGTALF